MVEANPDHDNGIETLPIPIRLIRMTARADNGCPNLTKL